MNKPELIDAIVRQTGQTKSATEAILNALLEVVTDSVAIGDTVQLVGFGTFKPAHRAAREGRNPQTGEALHIPEATLPKFTPGEGFKKKVAAAAVKAKSGKGKKITAG
jgi:nucleoid DNA-binding protein